ncbi:hypothetical protein ACFE04_023617 [Oxalis oulophora]
MLGSGESSDVSPDTLKRIKRSLPCDAVECVGKNVMSTTSEVTTGLVSQSDGLGAAWHAIGTSWTMFKIGKALNSKSAFKPGTLAKGDATATAEEQKKKKKKKKKKKEKKKKKKFITLSNGNVQFFINDSMILVCRLSFPVSPLFPSVVSPFPSRHLSPVSPPFPSLLSHLVISLLSLLRSRLSFPISPLFPSLLRPSSLLSRLVVSLPLTSILSRLFSVLVVSLVSLSSLLRHNCDDLVESGTMDAVGAKDKPTR